LDLSATLIEVGCAGDTGRAVGGECKVDRHGARPVWRGWCVDRKDRDAGLVKVWLPQDLGGPDRPECGVDVGQERVCYSNVYGRHVYSSGARSVSLLMAHPAKPARRSCGVLATTAYSRMAVSSARARGSSSAPWTSTVT